MSNAPTFFDYVCSNTDKFAMLFAFECLAGALSLALFLWTEPGTATRVVGILNLAGIAVLGAATGAILLKCHRM
ncbi:hypothetical protein [Haladaptatus salinisoli]|uniref:hypothetical protein n=1 Tax=Haladaptatus salinisoli TaxID=2884876 RepID=UPI001D0A3EFD|nr:hypothetical protein [Haladaptatus salinisoli]